MSNTIGEKIFKLRKEKGLTQEEVANSINVTRQTISKWELGQSSPTIKDIENLAKVFNISTYALIEDDVKSEKYTKKFLSNKVKIIFLITFIFFLLFIFIDRCMFIYKIRNEISRKLNIDSLNYYIRYVCYEEDEFYCKEIFVKNNVIKINTFERNSLSKIEKVDFYTDNGCYSFNQIDKNVLEIDSNDIKNEDIIYSNGKILNYIYKKCLLSNSSEKIQLLFNFKYKFLKYNEQYEITNYTTQIADYIKLISYKDDNSFEFIDKFTDYNRKEIIKSYIVRSNTVTSDMVELLDFNQYIKK